MASWSLCFAAVVCATHLALCDDPAHSVQVLVLFVAAIGGDMEQASATRSRVGHWIARNLGSHINTTSRHDMSCM